MSSDDIADSNQVISGLLVSVGHLCDLQGLFSEIHNLRTVNSIELQLMSMWRYDVDIVTSHETGVCKHEKDVT